MYVVTSSVYSTICKTIESAQTLLSFLSDGKIKKFDNEQDAYKYLQEQLIIKSKQSGYRIVESDIVINYNIKGSRVFFVIDTTRIGMLSIDKKVTSVINGKAIAVENISGIINVIIEYGELNFSKNSSHLRIISDILDIIGPIFNVTVITPYDSVYCVMNSNLSMYKNHNLSYEKDRLLSHNQKVTVISTRKGWL